MSIFGSIWAKLTGQAQAASPGTGPVGATGSAPGVQDDRPGAAASAPASGQAVDVSAVLDGLASQQKQKLDWRHSIVDMMKLLELDSSLAARKQLAQEMNYTGSTDDSAAMNIWLHGQVMRKLAENGGKVPEDLKH